MTIHHIGYSVWDMDKAINKFIQLGYCKEGDTIHDNEREIYIQFMRNGSYLIELISPIGENSPIYNILKKHGNSPYHICYEVSDIIKEITFLQKEKYILIDVPSEAPAISNRSVVFLYNKDVGIIELIQKERGFVR